MDRKHVLVPFERFQRLLALESRQGDSTTAVNRNDIADTSATPLAQSQHHPSQLLHCHVPVDDVAPRNREVMSEAHTPRREPAHVAESAVAQSGMGDDDGVNSERNETLRDLAPLRPPGVPAQRWLVWK